MVRIAIMVAVALVWNANAASAQCQAFFDKISFEQFNMNEGKFLKGIETFEESTVPDGGKMPFPAPLQGNVPNPVFPRGSWRRT